MKSWIVHESHLFEIHRDWCVVMQNVKECLRLECKSGKFKESFGVGRKKVGGQVQETSVQAYRDKTYDSV
jgi:hypothetical protein